MEEIENDNSARVLARVARLGQVTAIPGADRVALAQIDGTAWEVVVPAATADARYVPGAVGVYFEIDSVLPDAPWVRAAMGGADLTKDKARTIDTKRIRGVLSQGLFLAQSSFADVLAAAATAGGEGEGEAGWAVGTNLTAALAVTKKPEHPPRPAGKSEHPGRMAGKQGAAASTLRSWDRALGRTGPPKTDEPRIQNSLDLLAELAGRPYCMSLKIHGTSATFAIDDQNVGQGEEAAAPEFLVLSRNFVVEDTASAYYVAARRYGLEATLRAHPHMALQAEVYGPGINGNTMEARAIDLAVFSAYDRRAGGGYLGEDAMRAWCAAQTPPIPCVPIVERGEAFPANPDIKALLARAEGVNPGTTRQREGVVLRSAEVAYMPTAPGLPRQRLSCKIISNKFLLGEGKSAK